MKTNVAVLAIGGLLLSGGAQALVVDLAGEAVPGVAPGAGGGNPPNIISVFNGDAGAVTSIDFDLSYTSTSPSWGSEFFIEVTHVPSGTSVSAGTVGGVGDSCGILGPCDVDLGWDDSVGTFTASFSLASAIGDGSGEWQIWLGDAYDDSTPEPDGMLDFGSSVTINQVPVPAALWLFGSALAGLGVIRRRRR